jgi:hypothetical protein
MGLAAWAEWDYPVPILLMKNGLPEGSDRGSTSVGRKDGSRWPKG